NYQAACDTLSRFILAEITRLQRGNDDLVDTGLLQSRDVVRIDPVPLAHTPVTRRHRMGDDRTLGILGRDWTESHATLPFTLSSRPRERNALTTWARTATAISAGLAAPIFRPIGALILSMASGSAPAAKSRSTRLAWVFRLPSAPT